MLLYYITDRKGFGGADFEQRAELLRCIADTAHAGVDYIQLREKDFGPADLELLAREALHVIRDNSAITKLLINTHSDIALTVGAEGVHLPADSPPASQIRAEWGRQSDREPLIGVSAHSVADIQQAETNGADFAVLAPIFEKVATGGKGIGLDALREAGADSGIRILALGGVNLGNARDCLEAGAAGIAGIRIFQQGDVSRTVNALRDLARQGAQPAN